MLVEHLFRLGIGISCTSLAPWWVSARNRVVAYTRALKAVA